MGISMEYKILYKIERAENLRSKIMILKSSIEILELNFKSTYNKYRSKEAVPPFLFPKMTFDRLKNSIRELQYLINLTPELPIGLLETFLSEVDERLNRIMDSAIKLQDLLVQRTAGTEVFDNIDYHVNFQIEYSGLTKVFNAVDAFVYELVKRTMGDQWIRLNKYVPITVFGKRNFSINPETYVIYLPYYDCFRSKSWSALAHEVAHVFFRVHFEKRYWDETGFWKVEPETEEEGNFQLAVLAGIKDLHELCFDHGEFHEEDPTNTTYQIVGQINEIVCDMLSTYICGPASLFTFSEIVDILLPPLEDISLKDAVKERLSHPPFDARLIASLSSLEYSGVLSKDNTIRALIDMIVDQCEIKNSNMVGLYKMLEQFEIEDCDMVGLYKMLEQFEIEDCDMGKLFQILEQLGVKDSDLVDFFSFYCLRPEDKDFLEGYKDFVQGFTLEVLDSFSQMDIDPFSAEDWSRVNRSLERGEIGDLTPVQFSNLIWLKRFSVITAENFIDFLEYGKNRGLERKTFEEMVICGHNYYENTVVREVVMQ
jgi:hypothetical protein